MNKYAVVFTHFGKWALETYETQAEAIKSASEKLKLGNLWIPVAIADLQSKEFVLVRVVDFPWHEEESASRELAVLRYFESVNYNSFRCVEGSVQMDQSGIVCQY